MRALKQCQHSHSRNKMQEKLGRGIDCVKLTLWSGEMNDLSVFFKHVDFLNSLNRLNIQFLQRALQFLVICTRTLVCLFHFSAGRALSSNSNGCSLSLKPCELILIHDSPVTS